MPRVSILTAAHIDTPPKIGWLQEMILSVQRQTLTNWEMIIIDDLSPVGFDELKKRKRFADDSRIRWFRTATNVGPSLARNVAAELAESDAIIALDADDMLATPETLQNMYQIWEEDKGKIIYGFLQFWEELNGAWQVSDLVELPEYTFAGSAMNLNGLIPVTALHSLECHRRAGGWKAEMDSGFEDVEKWLAAGKAGFCGYRMPESTLLYRKHRESRSHKLREVNRREPLMRQRIMRRHADVFEGRFPMGCCGGGAISTPPPAANNTPMAKITTLDQYEERDKVWTKYNGDRQAAFHIRGAETGVLYQVLGMGHRFEVHRSDTDIFRRSKGGEEFSVGIPPPAELTQASPSDEPSIVAEQPPYQAPELELATIERLDKVAADSRGIILEPAPARETQLPEPTITEVSPILDSAAIH